MITPLIFWVLATIDAILVIYSFWDHDNRVYGNIIASFVSFILSAMLALYVISGSVAEITPVATQKMMNWSLGNQTTVYTYTNQTVVMQDLSLGYGFSLGSVVMLIVMILFIVDVEVQQTAPAAPNAVDLGAGIFRMIDDFFDTGI